MFILADAIAPTVWSFVQLEHADDDNVTGCFVNPVNDAVRKVMESKATIDVVEWMPRARMSENGCDAASKLCDESGAQPHVLGFVI